MAQLDGEERQAYVQAMFDRIAQRYDLINRLISGGQDMTWRRIVVEKAAPPPEGSLLVSRRERATSPFQALKSAPAPVSWAPTSPWG